MIKHNEPNNKTSDTMSQRWLPNQTKVLLQFKPNILNCFFIIFIRQKCFADIICCNQTSQRIYISFTCYIIYGLWITISVDLVSPSKINLNELIPFHYAYVKRDQYPYVFYLFLQQYCFKNIQDKHVPMKKKYTCKRHTFLKLLKFLGK